MKTAKQLEAAAADIQRLERAIDLYERNEPDNLVALEMLGADLRRAQAHWKRLLQSPEAAGVAESIALRAAAARAMPELAGLR